MLQVVPSRDPTVIEIEGTVARSALASAGGIRIYPGTLDWAARMVPGGTRHGPLQVNVRPELEWVLEVELGRPPATLPAEVQLDSPFGTLRITSEGLPSGYRVEGSLSFESGLVAAAKVGELRDFLVAVERHLGRRLEAP